MQEIELAWAAGFFEGEGTVRLNKDLARTPRISMGLQIINTDREPLEKFNAAVSCGKILGPYGPYGVSKKRTYVWTCNRRDDVADLILKLMPHLSQKRRNQIAAAQAEVAISQSNPRRPRRASRQPLIQMAVP